MQTIKEFVQGLDQNTIVEIVKEYEQYVVTVDLNDYKSSQNAMNQFMLQNYQKTLDDCTNELIDALIQEFLHESLSILALEFIQEYYD